MAKSKYLNIDQRREKVFYTSSGETFQCDYVEQFDEYGQPCLKCVGKTDLVELHQADRDSVDLKIIIHRYQQGDVMALEQRSNAFYGDLTQMPENAIDAANRALAAKQLFDVLPLAVKRQYDNNVSLWLDKIAEGDQDALKSIGVKYVEKKEPVVEPAKGDVES